MLRRHKTDAKVTDAPILVPALAEGEPLGMRKVLPALAGALVAASITLSAGAPAIADADKKIKIINETRHKIVRFYASRVASDNWEEDILGEDVLGIGQSVTINFGTSDFCVYDFKAEFDDGDTLVKNRVNVCELDTYRYSEE